MAGTLTLRQSKTPSLGIKLGQLLGKVSSLLKGEAIINGNSNKRSRADDFLALIELCWSDKITRISRTENGISQKYFHWQKI